MPAQHPAAAKTAARVSRTPEAPYPIPAKKASSDKAAANAVICIKSENHPDKGLLLSRFFPSYAKKKPTAILLAKTQGPALGGQKAFHEKTSASRRLFWMEADSTMAYRSNKWKYQKHWEVGWVWEKILQRKKTPSHPPHRIAEICNNRSEIPSRLSKDFYSRR
jgi:hypothetical protein